jgi:hypothetical protein
MRSGGFMFSKRRFLKYASFGFLLQITWLFGSALFGQAVRDFAATIYLPWALLGEYVAPSGPGGHAMPGGAIMGLLAGVIVYSLLLSAILYFLRSWKKD